MEDTCRAFFAELRAYGLDDALEIAAELFVMMIGRFDRGVLAVVAEIENNQVVVRKQMPPIGVIGVGCEAVAVRKQDARACRIAVTPDFDFCAVIEGDLEGRAGRGQLKGHQRLRRVVEI